MENTATLTVYNAGAGSGKTYAVVKRYLLQILSNHSTSYYQQILAITFTNKAVEEMKSRLLASLYEFSSLNIAKEQPSGMFLEIQQQLDIDSTDLQKRARVILHYLLHNYSRFHVQTIDKFTQALIRSFAYDLGLTPNFEVELNTQYYLEKTIDRLITQVGKDKALTNSVLSFTFSHIDSDTSWNLKALLLEVSKVLFNEEDTPYFKDLSNHDAIDFSSLNKQLIALQKENTEKSQKVASQLLSIFEDFGIRNDFTRNSIPNYFVKIEKNTPVDFSASWQKNISTTKFYAQKTPEESKNKIDKLRPEIEKGFLLTKKWYLENQLYQLILKNNIPVSLLKAVKKNLDQLKKEDGLLFISDFNEIISNTLKEQPAPFIYERLAVWYKDFFIDEFQDTSALQWQNLIPLCHHSMSSVLDTNTKGSLTIVGDAKQAIYRWRGGKAEQFMALGDGKHPFIGAHFKLETLKTNYRSKKNIVDFTNSFFTFLAGYFSIDSYKQLFIDGNKQASYSQSDGYVEISFIEGNHKEERDIAYSNRTLEIIQNLVQKGHELRDICVLTRKNKEAQCIAEYLSKNNIPVISSEALQIQNSDELHLLLSWVNYLQNTFNSELKHLFLEQFILQHKSQITDIHTFLSTMQDFEFEFLCTQLQAFGVFFDYEHYTSLPIYSAFEYVITSFKIDYSVNMLFFMNIVYEYQQQQNKGVVDFLEQWEEQKERLSLSISLGNISAVQIMTIHKSKGLEFPIVIYPYADTPIYKNQPKNIWLSPSELQLEVPFKFLYTRFQKKVYQNHSNYTKQICNTTDAYLELDNYNTLYVALTRAEKKLFIISHQKKKTKTTSTNLSNLTFSQLFEHYLNQESLGFQKQCPQLFKFGNFEVKSKASNTNFTKQKLIAQKSQYQHKKKQIKLVVRTSPEGNSKIDFGISIHKILSEIFEVKDIPIKMKKYKKTLELLGIQITNLEKQLMELTQYTDFKDLFCNENQIFNEREFWYQNEIFRPDRVEITPNKNVYIIDYKTGKEDLKNQHQLLNYQAIFKDMGYSKIHLYIVYLGEVLEIVPVYKRR